MNIKASAVLIIHAHALFEKDAGAAYSLIHRPTQITFKPHDLSSLN